MRKNHHGKKDRLVKRVFALCLALAVICTCLVPVFATEYKDVVDSGEEEIAGFGGDEAAGFGDDFPAVDDGELREVYDESEAAYPDEREVVDYSGGNEATRPVEGGEDNLDGGPNVKETEWGTVIEYDTSSSSSTGTDPVTQWSGEDDVVEKPDDKVVVSGDEIKKLQDMVVYRFWLRELNTLDLQDIATKAQNDNMTESEYLARNGEVLWNLYFIQAVPRAETIADYSSYINTPSSNRDPKGELRLFDYWYTLDEFGNRVRLNLTDPTSNILDDKTTTVNVYAAWKDGTVGSDEEEDVDHEDLVDKNPVPVDLETKAAASYKDEDGNPKNVDLPVEVKNLPSAADHLSVSHMGDESMQQFYEKHSNDFGEMLPILGLKISPKNAKGETVQPAKGDVATVTVSGLNALPEMEGATADTLKVLHQTADGSVETLDVLTYTNGTLTFETSSFSPFVVVRTDGYDTELLDERAANKDPINLGTINVGETQSVRGYYSNRYSSDHSWTSNNENVATVSGEKGEATITGVGKGKATITHKYYYKNKLDLLNEPGYYYDTWTVTVKDWKEEAGLYIMFNPEENPDSNEKTMWTEKVTVNGKEAKLADTTNATWTDDRNIFDSVDSLDKYIKYWPDGVAYTGDRKLEPGDDFRTQEVAYKKDGVRKTATLENMILDMYKGKLIEMYTKSGVPTGDAQTIVNQLEAKDITFTIIAHKISKKNGGDVPDKHIDCTVTVTCDKTFTAKFKVKKPGESGYTTVNSKLYLWNDKGNNTVKQYADSTAVPPKIDKDGATWAFDGWYPENADGTGPNLEGKPIPESSWPYKVSENELTNNRGDRVVNFYAHYKKVTSNVTITKQVTGLLGDTNRDFEFRVNITQNGVDCTGVTATKKTETGTETDSNPTNFTLKHGETVTLKNVPIGATIKVTEVTPGEHYTVSATGHNGEKNGGNDVAFTYVAVANTATASDADEADLMLLSMDEDTAVDADGDAVAYDDGTRVRDNQIIITNHCGLLPDTGVLLDTLPYIVILAVVVGGGILLMLRKRRKEDD